MIFWRKWHRWIGTIAGLFLLLMAGTGIFLQIDEVTAFTAPPKPAPVDASRFEPVDPVTDSVRAAALLEDMHPGVAITSLWLQARETGTVAIVVFKGDTKTTEIDLKTGQEGPSKSAARPPSTFLQKIRTLVLRFHTLGIGGTAGHIFGGLVGLLLFFLAASGLWLWFKMLLQRTTGNKRGWFW